MVAFNYRNLFDQLGDAVIVADADNRIEYVNSAAASLFAWSRENLIGQRLAAIAPPDYHALVGGFDWRQVIHNPELANQAIRLPMHRRDGAEIDIELTLNPLLTADGEARVVGLMRNSNVRRGSSAFSYLRVAAQTIARLEPQQPLERMCQTIVDTLAKDFAAVRAELWLPNPQTGDPTLCAVADSPLARTLTSRTENDTTAYITRLTAVALSGQPVVITDLASSSTTVQDRRALAAALIPFWLGDKRGILVYWTSGAAAAPLVDTLTMFMALAGGRLHESRLLVELEGVNQKNDASQALLDSLFSAAPVGLAFLDNALRCVRINDTLADFGGLPAEAHLGRTATGLRGALGELTENLRRQVLSAGRPLTDIKLSGEMPTAPAEQRHWLVNYYPVRDPLGGSLGIAAVVLEITEAKKAEALLRERSFLEAVLDNLKDGVVACDVAGNLIIVNQTIQDFYALPGQPVPPERWADAYDLFMPDGATRMTKEDVPLFRALSGDEVRDVEMVVAPKGGIKRVVLCNGQPIYDPHGRQLGAVVAMHDITEQKRYEARLAHQAQSDALTGLANRLALVNRLQDALNTVIQPESVAVLFLDLDRFKTINDGFGHQTGDRALIAIAKRLQGAVRETDTLARFGGDEFVIVCEDLAGAQEAIELSERIQAIISAPLALRGQATEMTITVSIGIAFTRGVERAEDLIRDADRAMYQAKQRGRACHVLLDEESRM